MKKKFNKILFVFILLFASTQNVFGITNTYITEMEDSENQKISRHYDGKTDRQLSIAIGEHSSNTIPGYCIDVGLELGDRKPISQYDGNLEDYLTEKLKSQTTAKNVANKINQYIQFGYNYNNQNSDKYFIATQKLIWDELYHAGYRKDYYGDDVYFTAGDSTYDISNEEATIKNNISNYYKTPSMCSSTSKLEIAVGETISYEDTSKVLSNYQASCSEGLICEIEGNTLKVTANKEAKEQKIKFSKSGIKGNENIIYKREGEQAVLVNGKPIEGVSCEFGIDTYKNVQTSGAKIVAIVSLSVLSIIMAYVIVKRNQYINAE